MINNDDDLSGDAPDFSSFGSPIDSSPYDAAPTPAPRRSTFAWAPEVDDALEQASKEHGVDRGLLDTFARIESSGRPDARTGSYKGLFQLSDDEFFKHGGQSNPFDPYENARAGAAKLSAEKSDFAKRYGRDPTAAELYMIHQQGVGGSAAHWANPDAPAWQNMYSTAEGRQKGANWARRAIWGNVPDDVKRQFGSVDNISSRDFTKLWEDKVARFGSGTAGSAPTALASAPVSGKRPPGMMALGGPVSDDDTEETEDKTPLLSTSYDEADDDEVSADPETDGDAPMYLGGPDSKPDFSKYGKPLGKAATPAGAAKPDFSKFGKPVDAASAEKDGVGEGIWENVKNPQQYKELAKGIIPGAISMQGTALQAPDVLAAQAQYGARDFGAKQLAVMDRIDRGESVPETEDAFGYQHMGPEDRAKTRKDTIEAQAAFNPTPIQDRTLYKKGEAVQEYAKNLFPAAPGYEKSVGRQLGEGLGSMVGGMPYGLFGTAPAAIFFSAAGAGEATQRAVEFDKKERQEGRPGLTQEQIALAGIAGVAPGATDLLPLETLLGRLPLPVPPGARGALAQAVGRIGGQAFVEGLQEGGQQFLQNLIAREVYNPNQSLSDEVADNTGVGAGVGALAQTGKEVGERLLKLAAGRRGRHAGSAPEAGEDDAQKALPPPPKQIAGPQGEQPAQESMPPPASDEEAGWLRARGFDDKSIAEMSPDERAAEIEEAKAQGLNPSMVPTPMSAPSQAPDNPTAEPVTDLLAQARDLSDPKSEREGLYIPVSSLDALDEKGSEAVAQAVDGRFFLRDFDDKGGLLVVSDYETAKKALEAKAAGEDLQKIIGEATGAGTGKPIDGGMVVQQRDKDGAVVRESLVTPDKVDATAKAFARAGHEVEVLSPQEALQRREEMIAAQRAAAPAPATSSRTAPVAIEKPEDVAAVVAPSDYSPAQGEANNRRLGHAKWNGLDISIETDGDNVRRGQTKEGREWKSRMGAPYGYFKNTLGADDMHVDVFVGPNPASDKVYVLDENDKKTGKFRQHKTFIGFDSEADARQAYASSSNKSEDQIGGVTEMGVDEFKDWLADGKKTKPVAQTEGKSKRWDGPELSEEDIHLLVANWKFVRDVNAMPKPESLAQFVISQGGLRDDAREVRHIMGAAKERPGLVNKDGVTLDDMALKAWESGFFEDSERPTIADFLNKLQDDLHTGAEVRLIDQDALDSIKIAGEMAEELNDYGITASRFRSEASLREYFGQARPKAARAAEDAEGAEAPGRESADATGDIIDEVPFGSELEDGRQDAVARDEAGDGERAGAVRDREDQDEQGAEPAKGARDSGEDRGPAGTGQAERGTGVEGARETGPSDSRVTTEKSGQTSLVPEATTKEKIAAEAKAKERKGGNEPMDVGMFGSEKDQTDLVDMAKEEPKPAKPSRLGQGLSDLMAKSGGQAKAVETVAAGAKAPAETASPQQKLVDRLMGDGFKTIIEARKFAKEIGLDGSNKEIDEVIERAVVTAARQIVADGEDPRATFQTLVDLYGRQPNLASRTGTSVANQAYSTPMPLAYLASRLAGARTADVVYEPTAGNGALLMEAGPGNDAVYANEIDPARAAALEAFGFTVSQEDAGSARQIEQPADAIVANPPFGAVKDGGQSRTFKVGNWTTTQIDHAVSLHALDNLTDNGKAVLILGGTKSEATDERRKDYRGKAKREFYARLYKDYNVTDHFTVSGDLYTKQGASWPVDVIVIDGRGASERKLPAAQPPEILKTWDQVAEKLPNGEAGRNELAARAVDRQAGKPAVAGAEPAGRDGSDRKAPVGRGSERVQPEGEGKPAAVRAERDQGKPADVGSRRDNVAAESRSDRDSGRTGDAADPKPVRPRVKREAKEGASQVPYEPVSSIQALDTLIPVNMATPAREAMKKVEERRGSLDEFVADRLGYDSDAEGPFFIDADGAKQRPFAAEQIDALAAAIDNIERGSAFVNGAQTGIGKGRTAAGVLRYAMKKGLTPVFMTEKPDLYGDMFRDLRDIGVPEMLGREPRMFITNAGETITLDEEALAWKQEAEQAKSEGEKIPARRGKFLVGGTAPKVQDGMKKIANGEDIADVVFTTYDQMNTVKGQDTPRRKFLAQVAPNAIIVMDEAHVAGGAPKTGWEKKDAVMNRADFAREIAAKAKGVMFSSATYAKRPDVMDLYARTDMGKAVDDPKELGDLIQRGGVPMQQIVASMLTKAGQYMRHERSFDGVDYQLTPVPVNLKAYKQFSASMQAIFRFDLAVEEFRDNWGQDKLDELGWKKSRDDGVGGGSASSVAFGSLMHNITNQMLLAIKAEATAKQAIEAHKAGEKPVIALANTNESFIKDFAESEDIKIGQPLDLDFSAVLERYLQRTLRITVKGPEGSEKKHLQIPVDELPLSLRQEFKAAMNEIKDGDYSSLPISPIDWIRYRLGEAGMSVKEVTGRQTMIDYSKPVPTYVQRPKSEQGASGKRGSIAYFNAGKLDALILNRSGSTGVSMHASKDFKDKRKRRMILAQAEGNIDTHLQMLGRVHRTGQVIPPAYAQIAAEIPAEARPTAVLMKKMASLNANTTGARSSAFTVDSVDFINEVGDKVVADILQEDPDLNEMLGGPLKFEENGKAKSEDVARKATGRLVLLDPDVQTRFLDQVQKAYLAEIEQLDALGENPLEAKTVDLQAKIVEASELKPKQGDSPFLDAVRMEKVTAKAQGRAMAPAEVASKIADALKVPKPAGSDAQVLASLESQGRAWGYKETDRVSALIRKQMADEIAETGADSKESTRRRLEAQFSRWNETMGLVHPGARVRLGMPAGDLDAVVMSVERTGKAKQMGALSAWTVKFAVPDSMRQLDFPMSKLFPPNTPKADDEKGATLMRAGASHNDLVDAFEQARKEGRETRYIMTGNILGGFDQTRGRGRIVNFTDEKGELRPGILMGREFSAEKFMDSRAVRFQSAGQIVEFMEKAPLAKVEASQGSIELSQYRDTYRIEMASARAKAGQFFTDAAVRRALGQKEFEKRGAKMIVDGLSKAQFTAAVAEMQKIGAKFEVRDQQDLAQSIVSKPVEGPMFAIGGYKTEPRKGDRMAHVVMRRLADKNGKTFLARIVESGDDISVQMYDDSNPNTPEEKLPKGTSRLGRKLGFVDLNFVGVGHFATHGHRGPLYEVGMVEVEDDQRMRGLAKATYNLIEDMLGTQMMPSGTLLPPGYEHWKRRNPDLVRGHQYHRNDEVYYSPKRIKSDLDSVTNSVQRFNVEAEVAEFLAHKKRNFEQEVEQFARAGVPASVLENGNAAAIEAAFLSPAFKPSELSDFVAQGFAESPAREARYRAHAFVRSRDAVADEKAAERYVMTRLESRREELAILRGMWRKVPKDLRSERAREAMFAKGPENDVRSDLEKAGVPKRTDFKSAIPDIRRAMGSILKSGRPVSINGEVVTAIHKAVDEVRGMVPAGAKVYALARVEPTEEPGTVIAVFEDQDGNEYPLVESWNYLSGIRAAYFEGNIFFVRLSPRALREVGQFNGGIAAELGHEVAHALRWSGRLSGPTWDRLLAHARTLRLLDGEFGTYLKIVGDPSADKVSDVTTREVYERLYNTRENRAELMDQEEVAHLVEWYMRGELSREQVEPVIDILDDIVNGRVQEADREESLEREMAFAAAEQGRAQRRELDRLGFYSKALEAAKDLRQAKGTPEQMRAMLRTAGVKEAELQAVGFDAWLAERARAVSGEEAGRISQQDGFDTSTVWYRGDKREWGGVDHEEANPDFPRAMYLTTDRNLASWFTHGAEGSRVGKFHIRDRNLFDYAKSENIDPLVAHLSAADARTIYPGFLGPKSMLIDGARNGDAGILELPYIQDWIKAQGFTGWRMQENGKPTVGMYSESDVRPASQQAQQSVDRTERQPENRRSREPIITKEEIISFLRENRVEVKEGVYGGDKMDVIRRRGELEGERDRLQRQRFAQIRNGARLAEIADELAALDQRAETVSKWSTYSIDPSNPTYRETVIHLPEHGTSSTDLDDELNTLVVRRDELEAAYSSDATASEVAEVEEVDARIQAIREEMRQRTNQTFFDLHWQEPNPVGHIRSQIIIGQDGKKYLNADNIQSGWQQAYRDAVRNGVAQRLFKSDFQSLRAEDKAAVSSEIARLRKAGAPLQQEKDEAKIARLKIKLDEVKAEEKRMADSAEEFVSENLDSVLVARRQRDLKEPHTQVAFADAGDLEALAKYGDEDLRETAGVMLDAWRAILSDGGRIRAELITAEQHRTVPSHPLIEVTETNLNFMLKNFLRQAIEAGVDGISITPGHVLSSRGEGDDNPAAMAKWMDQTVPRALRDLLRTYDKSTPDSVDQVMKSPVDGEVFRGGYDRTRFPEGNPSADPIQFHTFPLTDKVKEAVMEDGQPMFAIGGASARTAPASSRETAEAMERRRQSPAQILRDTGWFRGRDGKWRFEIDDSKASLNDAKIDWSTDIYDGVRKRYQGDWNGRLSDFYQHPDLYAAYPELAKASLSVGLGSYYGDSGGFNNGSLKATVNEVDNLPKLKSIIAHEIQHWIQEREGFSPGSSPAISSQMNAIAISDLKAELLRAEDSKAGHNRIAAIKEAIEALETSQMLMKPDWWGSTPADAAYRNVYGEVEARNVQARLDMTADERMATPPWRTEDVAPEDIILRGATRAELPNQDRILSVYREVIGSRPPLKNNVSIPLSEVLRDVSIKGAAQALSAADVRVQEAARAVADVIARNDDTRSVQGARNTLESYETVRMVWARLVDAGFGEPVKPTVRNIDVEGILEAPLSRAPEASGIDRPALPPLPQERQAARDADAARDRLMAAATAATRDAVTAKPDYVAGIASNLVQHLLSGQTPAEVAAQRTPDMAKAYEAFLKAHNPRDVLAIKRQNIVSETTAPLLPASALFGARAAGSVIPRAGVRQQAVSNDIAEAINIVNRIAGRDVEVRFSETMDLASVSLEQVQATERAGIDADVRGSYRRPTLDARAVITLATGKDDLLTTAGHEAWHHVEERLASEAEKRLLKAPSEMRRMRTQAAAEIGMDVADPRLAQIPDSEIRAIAFQKYRREREEGQQPQGIHIGVRRFFDRMLKVLAVVRNALAGHGIKTYEDVFESARTGEIAKREAEKPSREASGNAMVEQDEASAAAPQDVNDVMASLIPRVIKKSVARTMRRFEVSERVDRLRVGIQDKFLPVRRIQEEKERQTGTKIPINLDTYVAESLFHGRAGEQTADLKTDYIEPLVEILRKAEISKEQFDSYLYARHAQERNAEIAKINPGLTSGSGMTDAEANAILAAARGKQSSYDQAAKLVDAMIEETRTRLLKSGLISRETFDTWSTKFANYVPLRGFEAGQDEPDRPRSGRGFDIRGPEAMQALGRRSKADSPLAYALMQAQQAIIRAEKNRVDKTLYRFIQAYPDPQLYQIYRGEYRRRLNPVTKQVESYWVPPQFVRDDAIHGVKIGGKQYYMELKDAGLARAMRGVQGEQHNAVLRGMMWLSRTYASLLTSYNPEFVVSNFMRDIQTALANVTDVADKPAGVRRQMLKDAVSMKSIRGVLNALRGDGNAEYARWFEEYRQAGGKISFMEFNDVDRIQRDVTKSIERGRFNRVTRKALDLINDLNTAVENGVRLSTYIAMRKAGIGQDRAAYVARELTVNFNRKGEWSPIINSMYLFFNASVQGTTRMAQAIARSRTLQVGVASIVGAAFMVDWWNYMVAGDDDDGENRYDKIKSWIKERNLIIMTGRPDGSYIQIPMPYGYNLFWLGGQQTAAVMRGAVKPHEAAVNMGKAMFEVMSPIGGANGSLAQMAAPTMVDPFVQVIENKTWYGGPIFPTKYNKNLPDSENAFSSVNPWFQTMARTLNSVTGGNTARKGAVDVSPEVIEHFFEFAGGGLAKFISNASTAGSRVIHGEEWLPEKTPFVRRVYGKATTESRRRDFYAAWEEVDAAKFEIDNLVKNTRKGTARQDEIEAAREKYAVELQAYGFMRDTQRALSAMRNERRTIELNNKMPRAEKEAKLKEIQDRENQIILRSLGTLNRIKKQSKQPPRAEAAE